MPSPITLAGNLLEGTHASRPAATAMGTGGLYACSDHGLIYQSNGAAWSTWATLGDISAHTGDATDAHDASAISVLDAGTLLTATDVEAALAEIAGDSDAHIADAVDAHDATAISFTPAGTIAATTVQAAIEEVSGDVGAGGIPATIFDAAGDIIIASAADTAARLALGTAGQVLTVNAGATAPAWAAGGGGSGASDDLKQRANSYVLELDWSAGKYQNGGLISASSVNQSVWTGYLYFTPLYVPKAITVDRIGFNAISAAAAGDEVRLGIYESGADGMPGALLLDAGTVAYSTNGGKEITISQALSADTVYWLAMTVNAGVSGNTFYCHPTTAQPPYYWLNLVGVSPPTVVHRASFSYAALPNPAGTITIDSSGAIGGGTPDIRVRVA